MTCGRSVAPSRAFIDTATPLLDATDLSARPIDARNAMAAKQAETLHVDLTVQGHVWKSTG